MLSLLIESFLRRKSGFFKLVTNFMFLCFLMFSMVFPKTTLFISLQKSFSKSLATAVLTFVLKSIYSFIQADCLNSIALWICSYTNPCFSACSSALMWIMYLFLYYKLEINFSTPPKTMHSHIKGRSLW